MLVTRYGKNLFDFHGVVNSGDNYSPSQLTNNGDGTFTVRSNGTCLVPNQTLGEMMPALQVGKTYTLTAETTANEKYFYLIEAGGVWIFGRSRTITETDLKSGMYWYNGEPNQTVTISNIQLEEGTTATPYEPYVEPTYHLANADGTVDGVLSASPVTTLTSNIDGVIITAEYNKDTNAVINELMERIAVMEAAIVNN